MDEIIDGLTRLRFSLRQVWDGIDTGTLTWPEAEQDLREAYALALELEALVVKQRKLAAHQPPLA